MKKVFAILAIMVVLIAGCTSTNSAEEMIGIRGDITSIYIDNEGSTINVEEKKEEDTKYSKAIVNINKDTVIQNKTNDKLYNINDLELGMTVEVIFNEGVMKVIQYKEQLRLLKSLMNRNSKKS